MRVLVVDDDPGSRAIVRRIVSKALKCGTDEATNGLEALELLERRRYALVVLDLQMPVLSGIETLTAIREATAVRHIPVVMLTGGASEEQVRQAASLGVVAYLTKPIDPERLAERLFQVAEAVIPGAAEAAKPDAAVVLVCDSNPEFRQRAAAMLGDKFVVRETDSGTDMLRMLSDEHGAAAVQVVLCGSDTGLVKPDMLAKQVRQLPCGQNLTMCAALPKDEVGAARRGGLWDGVMSETLPPAMFASHFNRVVTSTAEARKAKPTPRRQAPKPAPQAPKPATAPAPRKNWEDDGVVVIG